MHVPLNVKLKMDNVPFIILIVTGSVNVTESPILTPFLIFDTMTENRLRLTPPWREPPKGRFISRSSATDFKKLHEVPVKCKVSDHKVQQPPQKNRTNDAVCYCDWFRQVI